MCCPQGSAQPGDPAAAAAMGAEPSPAAQGAQLQEMQPNRPCLSAQSEPWAGQAEAEHLSQLLRGTKDLHTSPIPLRALGETQHRWEAEAEEEGKPHPQR